ncbi:methylated-DNA--[protein]-cysteine S-methyltransferase [Tahibacter amnicola]|nr:methylated-DNA--[protein]-cysteine S-methyltransferase [Tahibacter amnicola]
MHYDILSTPIGPLLLAGDANGLVRIDFPEHGAAASPAPGWVHDPACFADAREQLLDYFDGRRFAFDLPLQLRGTPFQLQVWNALLTIACGDTCSYGDLASRLGRPSASRAVGAANGANPIPIIVPCHRVIGSRGELTGFGGGLPLKRWLLDHERRYAPPPPLHLR